MHCYFPFLFLFKITTGTTNNKIAITVIIAIPISIYLFIKINKLISTQEYKTGQTVIEFRRSAASGKKIPDAVNL